MFTLLALAVGVVHLAAQIAAPPKVAPQAVAKAEELPPHVGEHRSAPVQEALAQPHEESLAAREISESRAREARKRSERAGDSRFVRN